jgi:hypothetical protein
MKICKRISSEFRPEKEGNIKEHEINKNKTSQQKRIELQNIESKVRGGDTVLTKFQSGRTVVQKSNQEKQEQRG